MQSNLSTPPATLVPVLFQLLGPGTTLPCGPDWLFERKYDGYRAQIVSRGGEVSVFTRGYQDWTHRVPHIVGAVAALGRDLTFDGEICAVDEQDQTDLSWLSDPKSHSATIVFYAFDLLRVEGAELTHLPLLERKRMLSSVLPNPTDRSLRSVPYVRSEGSTLLEETRHLGHEGIVAKRVGATYEAGLRSNTWLKFKNRKVGTFRLAGCQLTADGSLSSLLLATLDDAPRYCGRVGTGFSLDERKNFLPLLSGGSGCALPNAPVRNAAGQTIWSNLRTRVEIEYLELSAKGIVREPSFRRLLPFDDLRAESDSKAPQTDG